MSEKGIVTIEWKDIKHPRHTGGLIITLPHGHNAIDFLRNHPSESKLVPLIECEQCPAYLNGSPGEGGVARPMYGSRFDEEGGKPSKIDICCEGTDIDAEHSLKALCKKRFAASQKIEVNLG